MSAIESERELEADEAATVETDDDQTIELAAEDTSVRALQTALSELGWPLRVDGTMDRETFTAVRRFQRGFAWWELLVDGYAGPKTWEAIEHARSHRGRCSAHFAFREFKCRCGRPMSEGCDGIRVSRELVLGLEEYRDAVGRPVPLRSGYRDPWWNRLRGGTKNSQHLYGNAADLAEHRLTYQRVKALRVFSGIGYIESSSLVLHVDVRHVGPNTTNGTPQTPTTWPY